MADPSNDRRQRRRFTKDDKLRILREAEQCTERGDLGALLRREGIYSSHLTSWRQQLRAHGEAGLAVDGRTLIARDSKIAVVGISASGRADVVVRTSIRS